MKRRALITLAAVAIVLTLASCTTADRKTGVKFWAPSTWPIFSGESTIAKAEKKAAAAAAAETAAQAAGDEVVHAAHVEVAKAQAAAVYLPPSRATDLVRRFQFNALGLLAQRRPLTAAESADLQQIVEGMLSQEAAARRSAEQRQAAAEARNLELAGDLEQSRALAAAAQNAARQANAAAIDAGLDNLELANELRAWRWRFIWLCIGFVLLLALTVYVRMGLGGVGRLVPRLPKLIGAENAEKVITALDGELDLFHQTLAAAARKKVERLQAKAAETLGVPPAPP